MDRTSKIIVSLGVLAAGVLLNAGLNDVLSPISETTAYVAGAGCAALIALWWTQKRA